MIATDVVRLAQDDPHVHCPRDEKVSQVPDIFQESSAALDNLGIATDMAWFTAGGRPEAMDGLRNSSVGRSALRRLRGRSPCS
jgi:hypothetical protein